MILVGQDETLSHLQGSLQFYKLFINYILRLHMKRFISAKQDPSFVLPESKSAKLHALHTLVPCVPLRLCNLPIIEMHLTGLWTYVPYPSLIHALRAVRTYAPLPSSISTLYTCLVLLQILLCLQGPLQKSLIY